VDLNEYTVNNAIVPINDVKKSCSVFRLMS